MHVSGTVAGAAAPFRQSMTWPYRVREEGGWESVDVPGPATSAELRAVGIAERAVLLEGALSEAGASRADFVVGDRAGRVLLDTCAPARGGALAGARVLIDSTTGVLERVDVRVAAGDPLDEVVLRSFCMGAAHMALGWVLSEALAVDPDNGRGARPDDPFVRRDPTEGHAGVAITVIDDPGEPLTAGLRCRVRGRRGGDVERAQRRRGCATRCFPGPRNQSRPRTSELGRRFGLGIGRFDSATVRILSGEPSEQGAPDGAAEHDPDRDHQHHHDHEDDRTNHRSRRYPPSRPRDWPNR